MKIGEIIYEVETCLSTNDLAREMASQGAEEGTAILSREQTRGRGTKGRPWFSVKDRGLYLSFILRPRARVSQVSLLPLMASVAVWEAIYRTCRVKISLRWPNDLMWESRKLGGILCESTFLGNKINYVVVGIGLNLEHDEQDFPEDIRHDATSLKLITGKAVDKKVLLENLWQALDTQYSVLLQGQGEKLIRSFEKHSIFSLGEQVVVQVEGRKDSGYYAGIDSRGGLVLEKEGKKNSYYSAEIKAVIRD